MNIIYTQFDRIIISDVHLPRGADPIDFIDQVLPENKREIVLTPAEYEGQLMLTAYDRLSDTLFIKVTQ